MKKSQELLVLACEVAMYFSVSNLDTHCVLYQLLFEASVDVIQYYGQVVRTTKLPPQPLELIKSCQ